MNIQAKAAVIIDNASMNSTISFDQLNRAFEAQPDWASYGMSDTEITGVRFRRVAIYAANLHRLAVQEHAELVAMVEQYNDVKRRLDGEGE